jgi:hypothetical protein
MDVETRFVRQKTWMVVVLMSMYIKFRWQHHSGGAHFLRHRGIIPTRTSRPGLAKLVCETRPGLAKKVCETPSSSSDCNACYRVSGCRSIAEAVDQ